MKEILYGTNDKEPHTETVAQLAQELYNSGLLISLVENLQVIDFEVSHCTFWCIHRYPFIFILASEKKRETFFSLFWYLFPFA